MMIQSQQCKQALTRNSKAMNRNIISVYRKECVINTHSTCSFFGLARKAVAKWLRDLSRQSVRPIFCMEKKKLNSCQTELHDD
jgi:hypothetical protein